MSAVGPSVSYPQFPTPPSSNDIILAKQAAAMARIERVKAARMKIAADSHDNQNERIINLWFSLARAKYLDLSILYWELIDKPEIVPSLNKAIQIIKKIVLKFFKIWPKADNHQHGEAIISSRDYIRFLVENGQSLYIDKEQNRVLKRDSSFFNNSLMRLFGCNRGENFVSAADIAAKEGAELKKKFSITYCPKGVERRTYFFDVSCNMIDSITEHMSFMKQNSLMVDELVRQNHTYAPIIIDLPEYWKKLRTSHLPKAFVALFKSPEFAEFQKTCKGLDWNDAIPESETLKQRLKFLEQFKPFLNKALSMMEKELPDIVEAMDKEFAKANAEAQKKHGEKCPTVKYIIPVMRCGLDQNNDGLELPLFFQQTIVVFALMKYSEKNSRLVRGYQLVGNEKDPKARENFLIQLFMIDYCRQIYPGGNVFLHTGELLPSEAPRSLRSKRIFDTVNLGYPEPSTVKKVSRVGHINTITDDDIETLLAHDVCAESCLTSNAKLLGVRVNRIYDKTMSLGLEFSTLELLFRGGYGTPIYKLREHGVPYTICADDPTHFGIKLANELTTAVFECEHSYSDVKNAQRVLRHYAPELDGESIYENHPVVRGIMLIKDKFKNVDRKGWQANPDAASIIEKSEKAKEQVEWEQQTEKYERSFLDENYSQILEFVGSSEIEKIDRKATLMLMRKGIDQILKLLSEKKAQILNRRISVL